jgi:iron complex outermembrane recepter protein
MQLEFLQFLKEACQDYGLLNRSSKKPVKCDHSRSARFSGLKKSVIVLFTTFSPTVALSQEHDTLSPAEIKNLSVEELMNIEVTSVSKVPQKLTEVASAIQVITRQDILRSAATSVPEALRLASNLQVSQLNSRHWVISSRGFNTTFSNKLLVLIDGRTVYSPLFAGVFWDAQNVLLEDIERIEVISGPGGTLWGANAVNGIINIITKSARDTRGLYVSAGYGTGLQPLAEARYGGRLGSEISYRLYGRTIRRSNTILPGGQDNTDEWGHSQTGFDLEWTPSDEDNLRIQGDVYAGRETSNPAPSSIDGQNIKGIWKHVFSDESNLQVQAYFDRTWRRDVPGTISDELYTYDLELQHTIPFRKNHKVIWGAAYRLMDDRTQNTTNFVGFLPKDRTMHLMSAFLQDEIRVIADRLALILGAKLQHNSFSGFEWQPSARIAYTPQDRQFLWAAVSRAIRAPSRIDVDYFLPTFPVPPTSPSVAGGPNFTSEKLLAYELGYRTQPTTGLSLSLSTFYNMYDDLYSVEVLPGTQTYQIQNGSKGTSWGAELSATYIVNSYWNIRGGYTFFHKDLKNKPGNQSDPRLLDNLGTDAANHAVLQSAFNIRKNFQLDLVAGYTDFLPGTLYNTRVPAYVTLDTRLAWQYKKQLELSLNTQNLLNDQHLEIGNGAMIRRGIFGKITWRY